MKKLLNKPHPIPVLMTAILILSHFRKMPFRLMRRINCLSRYRLQLIPV